MLSDLVVADRLGREILAEAGLLEAAVRPLGCQRQVIVDPDRAELGRAGQLIARPTSLVQSEAARP
jgi:hypothetical protein